MRHSLGGYHKKHSLSKNNLFIEIDWKIHIHHFGFFLITDFSTKIWFFKENYMVEIILVREKGEVSANKSSTEFFS